MIVAKKGVAYYLSFPAIDSTSPDKYKSGLSPTTVAHYKDGAGAWTSITLVDTATEIGASGVYEIDISAIETNHDRLTVKFAASGMADDAYQFDFNDKLVDDLQDIAATEIVSSGAISTSGGTVSSVSTNMRGTDNALTAADLVSGSFPSSGVSGTSGVRIDDILTRARDSLVDHDKQRWSDERLLRLVDEAQKDIARHSKLLKGTYEFSLEVGVAEYELPDEVWLITRASFDGCELALITYDKMDEAARKETIKDHRITERNRGYSFNDGYGKVCWEQTTGATIEALIYDNRNIQDIRVYPIPDGAIAASQYTFQNAGYLDPSIYEADSPYGVLTGVPDTDELLEELGVVVDADSILYLITNPDSCNGATLVDNVDFNSPFGLTAEIIDTIQEVGFHGDELLGEVVGIDDYTLDTVYGFTTDLYDPTVDTEKFDSPYGVVTDTTESQSSIKIWYIRNPATLVSTDSELEIAPIFDTALRLYVVGNAFLDDNDAAYRQKGQEFLAFYDRELGIASSTSSSDGVRSPSTNQTSYRGPFDQ